MIYFERSPSVPLRPFVESYWVLSTTTGVGDSGADTVYPDGRTELVLPVVSDVTSTPGVPIIMGPRATPTTTAAFCGSALVGIRLSAAGASTLLREDADRLADRVIDLAAVNARLARGLSSVTMGDVALRMRLGLLESALLRQLEKSARLDAAITHVAGMCEPGLESEQSWDVPSLARAAGLSTRQFERRFARVVGLNPKLYARIRRFHFASQLALQSPTRPGWAELAVTAGYFDQAHMIKDFRAFAHRTPSAMWAEHHAAEAGHRGHDDDAFLQDD
jgi:AraC-like DNA-binding protein